MKKLLLILSLTLIFQAAIAQTTYIQVNGEPGLSVFLNSQFKGKTTAEYNGYIIENVSPGQNVIRIVKEGFTPYEETISVKNGEVFAYKVKPFAKHIVNISEKGNTGETDKKAVISTGKLIVQSLPIEIKITMPDIEGVNGISKTKDEWMADQIPAGNYKITFTFNQKTITKTVEIHGDNTTSVFVNMLNGEFTSKSTLAEKKEKERQAAYIKSIFDKYKFKLGLTLEEFMAYNPEAKILLSYPWGAGMFIIPQKELIKKKAGPSYLSRYELTLSSRATNAPVTSYEYTLLVTQDYGAAKREFEVWLNEIKSNYDSSLVETYKDTKSENIKMMHYPATGGSNRVFIELTKMEKQWYKLSISFMD